MSKTQAERWCEARGLDGGDDVWEALPDAWRIEYKAAGDDAPTWVGEHRETAQFDGELEPTRVYAAARWQDGSGIIWYGDVWDTVTPDGDFACGLVLSWGDGS
jgi:hypothetical protein